MTIEAALPHLRATLLDASGKVLGNAISQVSVMAPTPGAREASEPEITAGLIESVAEAVGDSTERAQLIAITGLAGGLWISDDSAGLLRPAVLDDDTRSGELLDAWFDAGIAAAAFRRSGSAPDTGSLVTLLRYLEDEEPQTLDQATQASNAVAGLSAMLTGTAGASLATAPHHLIDPHHYAYDEELVDLYRLRTVRHLLPSIGDHQIPFNPLPALEALRSFLHPEAVVHGGTIDITAMLAGSGINRAGRALVHLGRTLDCVVITNRFDTDIEPAGITIGGPMGQYWIRALCGASGMSALDWFLRVTGHTYQELNALITAAPPGAHGAMALPLISTTGERAPFVDRHARGRLIGLSAETSDAELARAMGEGIAFAARHGLESAGIRGDDPITFCGSGVRAPSFRQLLADVLGRPVFIGPRPEPTTHGAAISAMMAAKLPFDSDEWFGPIEVVEPDIRLRDLYDDAYSRYLREIANIRKDPR